VKPAGPATTPEFRPLRRRRPPRAADSHHAQPARPPPALHRRDPTRTTATRPAGQRIAAANPAAFARQRPGPRAATVEE